MDIETLRNLKEKTQRADLLQQRLKDIEDILKSLEDNGSEINLNITGSGICNYISDNFGYAIMNIYFKECIKESLCKLQDEFNKEFQEL